MIFPPVSSTVVENSRKISSRRAESHQLQLFTCSCFSAFSSCFLPQQAASEQLNCEEKSSGTPSWKLSFFLTLRMFFADFHCLQNTVDQSGCDQSEEHELFERKDNTSLKVTAAQPTFTSQYVFHLLVREYHSRGNYYRDAWSRFYFFELKKSVMTVI